MFAETKTRGHPRLHASFGAIFMFVCLVSHQDCFKGSFGCGYGRGDVAGVGRSALCIVPHPAATSVLPWMPCSHNVTVKVFAIHKTTVEYACIFSVV